MGFQCTAGSLSHLARLERDINRLLATQRVRAATAATVQDPQGSVPLQDQTNVSVAGFSVTDEDGTSDSWASGSEGTVDRASIRRSGDRRESGLRPDLSYSSAAVAPVHAPAKSTHANVEALLGQELSEERTRRLRAEEAAHKLLAELEQEKQRARSGDHRYAGY